VSAGIVVMALHAALSLAISSVTDRKAAASAAVIMALLVSSSVAGALVNGAGASPYVYLLDLLGLPFRVVSLIYGDTADDVQIPMGATIAAYVAWTSAFAGFVWLRYRKLAVAK